MIDYDKLYYSARTNKYILIISSHNVNFDILKAIKQQFCELNNLSLDKVIIFNGYMTYEEFNAGPNDIDPVKLTNGETIKIGGLED